MEVKQLKRLNHAHNIEHKKVRPHKHVSKPIFLTSKSKNFFTYNNSIWQQYNEMIMEVFFIIV